MVSLLVKNGKIEVKMTQDSNGVPVYEELGEGIVQLLVNFQLEAIRRGNSEELIHNALLELMNGISINTERELNKALVNGFKGE